MKNKTFLILIGLATLIALGGLITLMLTYFESGETILKLGLTIVNLLGIIMLIRNGTLTKTIYFRYIMFCFAIVIIGALLKIMHWPGGAILLAIGLFGIPIIYTFRFLKKDTKSQLDIMKLIWVVTAYVISFLVITNWVPKELTYIQNIILLATIIHFASTCMKDKVLLER